MNDTKQSGVEDSKLAPIVVIIVIITVLVGMGWYVSRIGQCKAAKRDYLFDYALLQVSVGSNMAENTLKAQISRSDVVELCGEREALEVELYHQQTDSFFFNQ